MSAERERTAVRAAATRFAVLGRQLPFSLVVLVSVLVALTWAPWVLSDGSLVVPLTCVLVATLLAAVVPWSRLPRWAEASVPLLNMLALVFAEMAGLPGRSLILLPVLVLARAGKHGLMLAIIAGVAASWSPLVLDPDRLDSTRALIVEIVLRPTVIVTAAIVLFLAERRSAARSALLAGQSAIVEELLADARADRRLVETVLDTINTRVVVFDEDGAVRNVNRATTRVYGGVISPGRRAEDITVPLLAADAQTEIPPSQTPVARASRAERFDDEVVWEQRPDETRIAYRASAAPLDGGSGSVLAMEDLTQELEALAKREEFVSAVSHELRTPLTSIVGYLDLALADPGLGADSRRSLEVADRNARRLEILIENLLAAARGAERSRSRSVDLAAVVREVVENQAVRAADARVSIRFTGVQDAVVLGDEGRLTQVVDNLVSNAIKYSAPGCEVTITAADDDGAEPGRGTVRLEVRDEGLGIPPNEVPHVFERFYRARSARESTVQGTGLGLPITRQIVEDMGGTIHLESRVGRGTRVTVKLPAGGS